MLMSLLKHAAATLQELWMMDLIQEAAVPQGLRLKTVSIHATADRRDLPRKMALKPEVVDHQGLL
jgi:hypothetical protein